MGLSGYFAGSATSGVRAGLAALTDGFRTAVPLAKNASAQHARVRSEIANSVRSDRQRVPLRIVGDIETLAAVDLDGPRGVDRSALASILGPRDNATLGAGAWVTGATKRMPRPRWACVSGVAAHSPAVRR